MKRKQPPSRLCTCQENCKGGTVVSYASWKHHKKFRRPYEEFCTPGARQMAQMVSTGSIPGPSTGPTSGPSSGRLPSPSTVVPTPQEPHMLDHSQTTNQVLPADVLATQVEHPPSEDDADVGPVSPAPSRGTSPVPLPAPEEAPLPAQPPPDPPQLATPVHTVTDLFEPEDEEDTRPDPGSLADPDNSESESEDDLPNPQTADLKLAQAFIDALKLATLDNTHLSPELVERLRNPPCFPVSEEIDATFRFSLDLFLATQNGPQQSYHDVKESIERRDPTIQVLSYDQVKRRLGDITGVVSVQHDMCSKSCVGFTAVYSDLDKCPTCRSERYSQVKMVRGKAVKVAKKFHTFPIGPQLQALKRSPESAEAVRYLYLRTHQILDDLDPTNPIIDEYDDVCHGQAFMDLFNERKITEDDFVVCFSGDGAQLYRSKVSDCWIYIWVVLNLSPDKRYKKRYVLPGGIIPGPGKPKHLESFIFPGFAHVAALQKEGFGTWDADRLIKALSRVYMAIESADAPAMATLSGCVGHHGGMGCRVFCGMRGRHKPNDGHYYPALLRPDPERYNVDGSSHPDIDITQFLDPDPEEYKTKLRYLLESRNETDYELRRLETGIVKPSLVSGLHPEYTAPIPGVWGIDIMHVFALNIPELLLSLWRGTMTCGGDDSKETWEWAVLRGRVWQEHGKQVVSMTSYLPSSFDRTPRNPALKISSGYKGWEWLMYVFALGPGLFRTVLPEKFYKNFCRLALGIRILQQHRIKRHQLMKAHQELLTFLVEFEHLYYQRDPDRLHFARQCLHVLAHASPETIRIGPPGLYSQWPMERTIGNLTQYIAQHVTPYANLAQIMLLCCQINAIKAMIPDLEREPGLPRGSFELQGGYALLRARDRCSRAISFLEQNAIWEFYNLFHPIALEHIPSSVTRWARLKLPNGQVARSAWKECLKPLEGLRAARMVKLKYDNLERFAEVLYYFLLDVEGTTKALAVVSLFSLPDSDLLSQSLGTLVACKRATSPNDPNTPLIKAVDCSSILSVVAIPPLPISKTEQNRQGFYFVVEKPGLEIVELGEDIEEAGEEEE